MSRTKLLLADDSTTIQKVVNLTFADHGMDVFTFSDGDSAIAQFDEIKPDVVLADVHMPGMGGYRLCELVRRNEASRNTPVLLLVGSFEPFDQEEAERVGANGHLTKPFSSIADLISTVEDLVKVSPAADNKQADTSDIDTLYAQSFVETVEMPKNGISESVYELDGLDDEMIQTSYAGDESESEDSLYGVGSSEGTELEGSEPETEPESLIAESVPHETYDQEAREDIDEAPGMAADPFESVASEPQPAQSTTPGLTADETKMTFDDTDLLEIPLAANQQDNGVGAGVTSAAVELKAADLSPELIDLIVEKVVERLEQREKSGAAHSGSGN